MQGGELQIRLDTGDDLVFQKTPSWPILAGVMAAWIVLDTIVTWLRRGSLPRFGLVLIAASLLLIAVMVSGVVVRSIFAMVYPATRRVAKPVLRAACLAALWVPAWVLFVETWSLLMIAAGAICLACVGVFIKRCEIEPFSELTAAPQHHQPGTPFLFDEGLLARRLLPSLALVALLDAVVALAGARWFVASSIAAGIFAGVLGWRAVARSSPGSLGVALVGRGRQGVLLATAFVCTVIALLPYLRVGIRSGFSIPIAATKNNAMPTAPHGATSEGYPGIILLPLAEVQKKIIAPVRRDFTPHFGVKIAEPLEIPFDGQYWYFKWPDKRPRSSARVVRGSSVKTQVSSSDLYPLTMEAHQKLAKPLDLGCCSAMNLVVENADQLSGAIGLELWVRKLPPPKPLVPQKTDTEPRDPAPHYLGTVTIPSSELPIAQRPNASGRVQEETLKFPIPAAMDGVEFDEITVVVRTAPERAKMGAKVAVKKFVLEP